MTEREKKLRELVEQQSFKVTLDPRDGGDTIVIALDDLWPILAAIPETAVISEEQARLDEAYKFRAHFHAQGPFNMPFSQLKEIVGWMDERVSQLEKLAKPVQGSEP